jgi:Tfp pilus tip-associated adhesin PilY1
VFGTGKYLGEGDVVNDGVPLQSVYGIRDQLDRGGSPITVTHSDLQVQILSQTTISRADDPNDGAVVRTLSSNPIPFSAGGWYFDLNAESGERVVVTPSALFNTNTVLINTLVPKGLDFPPEGSLMAVDAATGGPGGALATIAGVAYAGVALSQTISTGTLPMVTPAGGGKILFPSLKPKGKKSTAELPLSLDSPIWRRRSWAMLNPTQ